MLSKYFPTMLITSTSSTSASIPVNIQACHDLGISPKVYSFSVPLGATVSLDGSAMVTAIYVLSIARISGIELNITQLCSVDILDSSALCERARHSRSKRSVFIYTFVADGHTYRCTRRSDGD